MEYDSDNYTNCDWCFWHGNLRIIKGHGRFGRGRPSGEHPNNSITENGQNTEKSPRDLRRLVVTQSQVKEHQLTLMWKTIIIKIIIIIIIIRRRRRRRRKPAKTELKWWSTGNSVRDWNLSTLTYEQTRVHH